jgi:Domain of unknown function (DUF4136)
MSLEAHSLSEMLANRWLRGAAALAIVLTACTTLQVGSDYDRAANFSNYHTFVVMQRQHQGTNNPLVPQRTEDGIKRYLISRGYTLANDPASADFVVDFTIGAKERTEINTYPEPYAGPWFYGNPWWGSPYWGNTVDVRQFHEGTLSIDIFDGHSKRPVWHGWARKELSSGDIEHPAQPIQEAIEAVLAKFPPGREGS